MSALIPSQPDQPTQPPQPTTSQYVPYQWEPTSQPANSGADDDARPGDVAYMWDAPSQSHSAHAERQASAPTTERDPREAPTSLPGAPDSIRRSGPVSRPVRSGPLSGPIGASDQRRPRGCVLAAGGCLVMVAALIALCAMSLGVITALAAVSQPANATTTRTLHVSGAPTLNVTSSAASVRVTGDPSDNATVTVTMAASVKTVSYNSARSIVQGIKLTTNQSGNTITIGLTDNDTLNFQAFLVRNVTLDITTPTHSNLSGSLQAGSLLTDDLTGALNVTTNAGAITLHRMTFAGASILRLSAGSLVVDGALTSGATVNANVNAGSVICTLPRQSGAHLDASATSGSVSVVGWNATVTHNVANASTIADVGAHPIGALTIRVNAGSVVVTLA